MAFPLATVLSAAPGIISAAADIIRMIRERSKKDKDKEAESSPEAEKLKELVQLIEQQAMVIEELAINNRNMALAVRNNRIFAILGLAVGAIALLLAVIQIG